MRIVVPPKKDQVIRFDAGRENREWEIWQAEPDRSERLHTLVRAVATGGYQERWQRNWWLLGLAVTYLAEFRADGQVVVLKRTGGEGLRVHEMRSYPTY